jgi:hypothetical protein
MFSFKLTVFMILAQWGSEYQTKFNLVLNGPIFRCPVHSYKMVSFQYSNQMVGPFSAAIIVKPFEN